MNRAVMGPAERYREFVASLAPKRARLHVPKMMRVRWLTAAYEAWLLGDVAQMLPVAVPTWCADREHAFVDASGLITSGAGALRLVLRRDLCGGGALSRGNIVMRSALSKRSRYPLNRAGSRPGYCSGMEDATGAPSSFAVWDPKRLRASGRDGETVSPVAPQNAAFPTYKAPRVHHAQPGHRDQQRPVTAAQSRTRRRTPQGDVELMAKKQVLGFQPAPRLEQVDHEHSERV